jgi:drug/metabolite transporter (DMT)-like permease
LIGLLCLIWGSTWLVIRRGLDDLPPFTSAAARFALASLVMAALAPWLARREGGSKPSWRLVIVLGVLNFGLSYGIVYWTETHLPSSLVCVLWSVFPLVQAGFGHAWLPGERLVGRQWFGLVLGLAGVVLLFLTDLRELGPTAVPAGLILLISPIISAVGTLYVKRHAAGTSSVLLNRNALAVGALLLLVLAGVREGGAEAVWSPTAVGSILYLAVMGTVVSFGVYFWLLRYATAWLLSLIAYVTPLIALWLGATVGGERVGSFTIAGTATILMGVALVLASRGGSRGRRAAAAGAETAGA